jgi:ABC-2 type transport system ATP-binding protein
VFATAAVEGSELTDDGRYRRVVPDMDAVESVREAAAAAGGEVVDIRTREPSLEDVFLELAGRPPEARDDGRGRTVAPEADGGRDGRDETDEERADDATRTERDGTRTDGGAR